MAAIEVENSVGLSGSHPASRSLTRTRDILIETMQLVEHRKDVAVPNHLLDTKLYSKVASNVVVQAQPSVVHFSGFEPGVLHTQVLELVNVSTEVQRMHVIPPQTKYFYVKYKKGDRLVPGLALECTVEFRPDEWRYYYDCIRVHCKGEENLVIPIHAYPVMTTSDFPKHVSFPPVPVGHSRSKVIPLRCQAPIDFEFQLHSLQHHPAFRVGPMAGVVPANGEVDIIVTFSPTEFSTACMKLQLNVSQFNAKPLVCTFSGSSVPGLAKDLTEKEQFSIESPPLELTLDPRAISPLDIARKNRKAKGKPKVQRIIVEKEMEKDGVKFPENLDTPYAVAQVLNQQPGKLRIKDLRDVVMSKKGGSDAPTRQMKEAVFDVAVRQNVYEERQNQLRWQVKVGEDQITGQQKQEVRDARENSWLSYKRNRGDPAQDEELLRLRNNTSFRRSRRDTEQVAEDVADFDMYKNNPWAVRHSKLQRFQQAARKIIIRQRADSKLRGLRQMIIDWSEKKYSQNIPQKDTLTPEPDKPLAPDANMVFQYNRIQNFTFPTYAAPQVKDDMAVDSLGAVPYKPTDVVVQRKVPFQALKVPQQYQLMGYKHHNVQAASQHYVPANLARPLRTGAEEEVISLAEVEDSPVAMETDLCVEEADEETAVAPSDEVVVPIKPPRTMFQPIDYPALHVFNPAPGLQVFQPPLQYAETDPDFHLCPLPRYTSADTTSAHTATQKQYLDRDDTVRGIMMWKKFPSQGLTSLTNTPTMSGVWVPRWQDPFNEYVLPEEVPTLYNGLSEEDTENLTQEPGEMTEEEGEVVSLTPEMVLAEFPLVETTGTPDDKQKKDESFPYGSKMPTSNIPVATNGPVPRERREQELDYFLKKKYNRLGSKVQSRVNQLNSLKTNPNLTLK